MATYQRPLTQAEIQKLLNNMTLGTARAKLGDIIIELQTQVADLQARVEVLEAAAE